MQISKEQLEKIIKEEKINFQSEKKYSKAMIKIFIGVIMWLIIMIFISLK